MEIVTTPVEDLDKTIEEYKLRGYRLDMIFPADAPRDALMSNGNEQIRLKAEPLASASGPNTKQVSTLGSHADAYDLEWTVGRAGMMYRDISPKGLKADIAVSEIRLTTGGEVPDYVHYNKLDFQMIYCKLGRIRVVYEDQCEPFWLETGDCVLQPPEIRHRVLECTAGAEVIEVSSPAEHETWVEHDMNLPTRTIDRDRTFSGQKFVRSTAADVSDGECDKGIALATDGQADVKIVRTDGVDKKLLISLRGLGTDGNGPLAAPVTLEVPI